MVCEGADAVLESVHTVMAAGVVDPGFDAHVIVVVVGFGRTSVWRGYRDGCRVIGRKRGGYLRRMPG